MDYVTVLGAAHQSGSFDAQDGRKVSYDQVVLHVSDPAVGQTQLFGSVCYQIKIPVRQLGDLLGVEAVDDVPQVLHAGSRIAVEYNRFSRVSRIEVQPEK